MGIFSTEGVMRSLENLTVPISTFNITEDQKDEILKVMKRCGKCNRWKYSNDLYKCVCATCYQKEDEEDKPKKKVGRKPKVVEHKYLNTATSIKVPKDPVFQIDERDEEAWLNRVLMENKSMLQQKLYIMIRDNIINGMDIVEAVEKADIKYSNYVSNTPTLYKKRLMEIKQARTYHKNFFNK